jgi:hypothetical protein
MLHLRHNNRVRKGTPRHSILYPFPFSSFSISCNRDRERGIPRKGPFSAKEPGSEPPTTDKGFEGWPSEGFNSRLRSRGPDTHYWSGVRRPALQRVPWPPQATRAPRPLLIRGSKAGPPRVQQSPQVAWARHPLLVRGSKAGPPKGSMAASGYSGSAPITDQGFEGWPPKGSQSPQTPSEG